MPANTSTTTCCFVASVEYTMPRHQSQLRRAPPAPVTHFPQQLLQPAGREERERDVQRRTRVAVASTALSDANDGCSRPIDVRCRHCRRQRKKLANPTAGKRDHRAAIAYELTWPAQKQEKRRKHKPQRNIKRQGCGPEHHPAIEQGERIHGHGKIRRPQNEKITGKEQPSCKPGSATTLNHQWAFQRGDRAHACRSLPGSPAFIGEISPGGGPEQAC